MSSSFDGIVVKGAKEHNLKDVNLTIPRNKITVVTGLSGSGKSSLAFDTLYAEGQRRYVEGLSSYARHFLDQLKKPEVDSVTGLSPAIAIEQQTTSTNPRSTLGTVTETYDLLRLLFSKIGVMHCPFHKKRMVSQSPEDILKFILSKNIKAGIHIYSPVVRSKKGSFADEIKKWIQSGYIKARVDGKTTDLGKISKLSKTHEHSIDLLIDKMPIEKTFSTRILEAIHISTKLSDGYVTVFNMDTKVDTTFSIQAACPECGHSPPEQEPRLFSFNNPRGYCPSCEGLGVLFEEQDVFNSEDEEAEDIDELSLQTCSECEGYRINKNALNVFINKKHIGQLTEQSIESLHSLLKKLRLTKKEKVITEKLLKNLLDKLTTLVDLGIGYLSLSRPTRTLSGGEAQRIRLATQLDSSLIGILYVLDEPSIGLHASDQDKLITALERLRDLGNTVILVEHDEETIRRANHIVDIGPRAGRFGGEILATGTPHGIASNRKSLTGQYLSGKKTSHIPYSKEQKAENYIEIKGASGNNLQNITVQFPLKNLIAITGVSGSGKSTLIVDTLYRAAMNHLYTPPRPSAPYKNITGLDLIDYVVEIDQKPIGRTSRSNPSTYVGLFSMIRDIYSHVPESRMKGYKPGRFSFNVKGGRCEACSGAGTVKVEMHFLADVFVLCEVCSGKRYNFETLHVKYRDKTIADVLDMSVGEALSFFKNHKHIQKKLDLLHRVGLDYIKLGQSSTTLSGGEAQRIKLAKELSKKSTGKTLYILDEPTTGLHFEDVRNLISLLQELVSSGNTVIVIEHNLDVIRSCSHVIDLGPGGGDRGGKIIATGSPEDVQKVKKSLTGKYLSLTSDKKNSVWR